MADTFTFTRGDFPDGFKWGVATSAYQIEGHAHGGAGLTHWDSFAATPGNVVRAEHGRLACDHYHRFPEDIALMKAANLDGYRFSTSWARVMPDGVNINPKGLDFYDRLLDTLAEAGLERYATLYHWELPQPMADIGGWRNREVVERFADYAGLIARKFGDRLTSVAPINEPWCVAWLSHFLGHHAPGMRDIRAAARAMHHVSLGHGMAVDAMRAEGQTNIGAVCNFEYAMPLTDSDADAKAARLYDGIYNRWFLGGFFHGAYPEDVLEGLELHMPEGWQDDMATIKAPVDWLGLNYYTCKRIAADPGPWPGVSEHVGDLPLTQMGWEIYPEGLHHFLTRTARDYTGNLPLYVTENGMSNSDTLDHPDRARIDYLNQHVTQAKRAIAEGVPLKGYVIWSLLDNYEWSLGYEKRFGLIHVDFDTLVRTPKASYHALTKALRHD